VVILSIVTRIGGIFSVNSTLKLLEALGN